MEILFFLGFASLLSAVVMSFFAPKDDYSARLRALRNQRKSSRIFLGEDYGDDMERWYELYQREIEHKAYTHTLLFVIALVVILLISHQSGCNKSDQPTPPKSEIQSKSSRSQWEQLLFQKFKNSKIMEDLMEASTDLTITEIITVELQTITDAYFDDDDLLTDPPLRCDGYEIFGVWI